MILEKTVYFGIEAVLLENELLRVIVVPSRGGKIASIVYKEMGLELLWQNKDFGKSELEYGQQYEEGDFSGFDEMFPAITAGKHPDEPWKGVSIPDHGEVWTAAWNYELLTSSVQMWVQGVRFPYTIVKKIWLDGDSVEHTYTLNNNSNVGFQYVYAVHPLFNVEEGSTLIVPEELNTVINAVSSRDMQVYGKEYDYPIAALENCKHVDISAMQPKSSEKYKKFYFRQKNKEGWCVVRRPEKGLDIRMDYSPEALPYLGVWMNEGGLCGQYNMAPEPASGAMDSVEASVKYGMASALEPKETKEWKFTIRCMPMKTL